MAPKDKDFPSPDPHDLLDSVLRAVTAIREEPDEQGKMDLAWGATHQLKALLKHFNTILAYTGPSQFGPDGNATKLEHLRTGIAYLLINGLPISELNSVGLGKAVLALNEGEVHDILTPSVTYKRSAAWSISRIEFLLCIHVWIFRARGWKAIEARKTVADLCPYTGDENHNTIRRWEGKKYLAERFSDEHVAFWKQTAKDLGAAEYPNDGNIKAVREWWQKKDMQSKKNELIALRFAASNLESPCAGDDFVSPLEYAAQLYQRALNKEQVMIPHCFLDEKP